MSPTSSTPASCTMSPMFSSCPRVLFSPSPPMMCILLAPCVLNITYFCVCDFPVAPFQGMLLVSQDLDKSRRTLYCDGYQLECLVGHTKHCRRVYSLFFPLLLHECYWHLRRSLDVMYDGYQAECLVGHTKHCSKLIYSLFPPLLPSESYWYLKRRPDVLCRVPKPSVVVGHKKHCRRF